VTHHGHTIWLAIGSVLVVAAGCLSAADGDASDQEPLVIAGGGTSGVYYNYGEQLATVAAERLGVSAEVQETGGSIENLHRIADGSSVLALTAADAAAAAVAGHPPFEQALPLRAVARVYDDFVHLVVADGSDIENVHGLEERRVSLGAEGSGTEVIARRLLATAGLSPDDVDNMPLGIDASIEALRAGEIEAFFWSGGLSTPGLHRLADEMPIRLVALGDLVDSVSERYGHVYRHAMVPRGTYGIGDDVPTMAVPNYLVTHPDVDEGLVYDLAEILFEQRAEMAELVAAVGLLERRRAIFTEPVELHDGALRYYRESKR
jgi:uncharacterized protein